MRSDPLTKGINAAPQRSLLKALGLCDAEIGKPLIGVVSSQNDIVPGHMNLDKIVNAVKQGVALGGGVPIVFPAIAVCDGLAMGHVGMKYSLANSSVTVRKPWQRRTPSTAWFSLPPVTRMSPVF